MTAEKKLVQHRLSLLELAQALGSVSEACRRRGVSRTRFYEYKRRFQTHGMEGLKDLPPIARSHPMTTPGAVVERVVEIALEHPAWGCNRVSQWLSLQGVSISPPTVQKIWNERELGSRYDRWLALERHVAERPLALTADQVRFLEKQNPQWRERHVESSRPGELLCQDTFFVGHLKGVGKVYLQAVVDTFSSYAFGLLATTKQPETAALLLHNDVLPFYREKGIEISALLTDNGREFCGTEAHPYELYLALNDLEHRRTQVRRPQTNGFVERFNRTVLDEFFREVFRETFYESAEALQQDLDHWLMVYNTERPHQGYRNQGRRPIETIELYLRSVPEAA
jgi:transposase InsO family protein